MRFLKLVEIENRYLKSDSFFLCMDGKLSEIISGCKYTPVVLRIGGFYGDDVSMRINMQGGCNNRNKAFDDGLGKILKEKLIVPSNAIRDNNGYPLSEYTAFIGYVEKSTGELVGLYDPLAMKMLWEKE